MSLFKKDKVSKPVSNPVSHPAPKSEEKKAAVAEKKAVVAEEKAEAKSLKSFKAAAKKSDAIVFLDSDKDLDFRASIDDPIRDLNNNLVDVNNDVLEGDHRIDGGKLVFAEAQLTPQDESDLAGVTG